MASYRLHLFDLSLYIMAATSHTGGFSLFPAPLIAVYLHFRELFSPRAASLHLIYILLAAFPRSGTKFVVSDVTRLFFVLVSVLPTEGSSAGP